MSFTYKGLKAVLERHIVTDSEVERQIQRLQQQYPRVASITDRATQLGDEVILDYAGFCDGEQFAGGTAEMQTLVLGSGMFIPGFEDQLIHKMPGEEVIVKVTFPQQYHSAELAGKEAVFHCTVHAIQTHEVPELNDEFAKQFNGIQSLEDMKAQLKQQLQAYADQYAQNKVRDELLKELVKQVENVTFDEAEVKAEIALAVEGFAHQMQQRGMSLEAYLQACGRTREEMDEELRPQAEDTIKARMALNEICRLEGITVTQEEVDAAYQEVANMYQVSVQEVKDAYGEDNDEKLRKDVLLKKAIAVLEANAEIVEG